jgi:hypothetical protein
MSRFSPAGNGEVPFRKGKGTVDSHGLTSAIKPCAFLCSSFFSEIPQIPANWLDCGINKACSLVDVVKTGFLLFMIACCCVESIPLKISGKHPEGHVA